MSKEKKYFIIVSIVIIALATFSIMTVDASMKASLEAASKIPGGFGERMVSVLSKRSFYIVPNVISIIISLITLAIAFTDKLSSSKGFLIGLSIALFITAGNTIVSVLAIVSVIMSANIKSDVKEKKDIPGLERYTRGIYGLIIAVACFAVYFGRMFLFSTNSYILSFVANFFILLVIVILFWDNLKRDFLIFIKSYKEYISFMLPRLGIIYIIYIVFSLICMLIGNNVSVNQQQIESLPIWYTFPLAVIFAPIVEEILFRGCIRRFVKNDILFIIISGVTFGLLHTIGEDSLFMILIMAIPYSVLGCGLAYIYAKTNNITSNISCHALHNFISMLLQIILL